MKLRDKRQNSVDYQTWMHYQKDDQDEMTLAKGILSFAAIAGILAFCILIAA